MQKSHSNIVHSAKKGLNVLIYGLGLYVQQFMCWPMTYADHNWESESSIDFHTELRLTTTKQK